jgi:RNA polymerase sigma-70 factor (ECF subfamily)
VKEFFMTTAFPETDATTPHRTARKSELRARLAIHLPDLYNRALRLSRNDAVAQDVLQDTFERALRFEDQYEPDSNLRAWLQRILLSVFITRCRRLRRERAALEHLANDPCAWTAPDGVAATQTLSPAVARALRSLPEAFRRAVELVDVSELSYRDAAVVLSVPLGTVMSRLHRGRRMLADALRPEAPSERGPSERGSSERRPSERSKERRYPEAA